MPRHREANPRREASCRRRGGDSGGGVCLANEVRPDLILTDINLGNTDGFALLAEVRVKPATGIFPVIMMTGRQKATDTWCGMDNSAVNGDHQIPGTASFQQDVARWLGISVKTVDTHRTNLMRKSGLHSIAELVRYAIRHGLVDPRNAVISVAGSRNTKRRAAAGRQASIRPRALASSPCGTVLPAWSPADPETPGGRRHGLPPARPAPHR